MLVAALAFGSLVLLTPGVALLFREPLNRGGVVGLVTLYGLAVLLLALSVGCLALFMRGYAQSTIKPDHGSLEARATPDACVLMRAFDFDPEDLHANRAGKLSARQRANLRAGRSAMLTMGATMLGVTYLSVTAVPAMMEFNRPSPTTSAGDSTGMWIALGVITVLVGASFVYGYRLVKDQLHQRLSIAEGEAEGPGPAGGGSPGSGVRTVRIGDAAVPIFSRAQAAALRTGQWYRVCYVRAPIAIVLSIDSETQFQDRTRF